MLPVSPVYQLSRSMSCRSTKLQSIRCHRSVYKWNCFEKRASLFLERKLQKSFKTLGHSSAYFFEPLSALIDSVDFDNLERQKVVADADADAERRKNVLTSKSSIRTFIEDLVSMLKNFFCPSWIGRTDKLERLSTTFFSAWGQCYKTFFVRDIRVFILS